MKKLFFLFAIAIPITIATSTNARAETPEYLMSSVQVFVLEGPLEEGAIIGTNTVPKGGTVSLTAQGLSSDNRSIDGTLLRWDNGTSATRALTYFWSATGGTFTNSGSVTTVWQAPEIGGSYTVVCVIAEGPVILGRPVGVSYGTISVTTEIEIFIVAPPMPQLTRIEVIPTSTTTVVVGTDRNFELRAYDQFDVHIPDISGTWTSTITIGTIVPIGSCAVFSAGTKTETGTISVSVGSLTANTAVELIPATASVVVVVPATNTMSAGGTQTISAFVRDQFGNLISNSKIKSWNWNCSSGSITTGSPIVIFIADEAGAAIITLELETIQGVQLEESMILSIEEKGILTYIKITPETATVKVGSSTSFTAQGFDQYGTPIQGLFYNWSTNIGSVTIGSLTSNIIFVAGTKATEEMITVTSGTVTAIATITIVAGEFASFTVAPKIMELHYGTGSGGTQTTILATLSCKDAYGNMVSRQGTWTLYAVFSGGEVNPHSEDKLFIPSGNEEFEFSLDINPKKCGWGTLTYVMYPLKI
jgi:hypothetical protein